MSSEQGRCELPHEILATEVLPRLPAKSLLRFRNVCKAWRDLISDPAFIEAQLLKQQTQGASISNDGTIISSPRQLNILARCPEQCYSIVVEPGNATAKTLCCDAFPVMRIRYPRFWGSCNGLICVEFEEEEFCLWNPCTQSYKKLPSWNVAYLDMNSEEEGFRGDYTWTFGLGYDAKIKDYKLVRIGERRVDKLETHVFTLGTNSWRIIDNEEFCSWVPGKFVDGFLYWKEIHNRQNREIFRFDIHDEVFSWVRLPDVLVAEGAYNMISKIEISEVGGCLALVREYRAMHGTRDVCHELWVMKENWVKMYSINIPTDLCTQFRFRFVPVGSLCIGKEKNDVEIVYQGSDGRIYYYNRSTNQFRRIGSGITRNLVIGSVKTYVESLVLLEGEA